MSGGRCTVDKPENASVGWFACMQGATNETRYADSIVAARRSGAPGNFGSPAAGRRNSESHDCQLVEIVDELTGDRRNFCVGPSEVSIMKFRGLDQ